MSAAERIYRVLLRAYPAEFRAKFGGEMAQAFRDLRIERESSGVRFWAAIVWDVMRSAPELRMQALRERSGIHFNIREGIMKTMAILAILIGALEVVNSLSEAWAGGVVRGGGASLAGGTIGALAGALIVASAIALLRRTPRAVAFAQGAAITCLAVFVCIAVIRPMFSGLATLLGIGFPIAMIVFLFSTRGRSTPSMA
jgi:hypothetical protein